MKDTQQKKYNIIALFGESGSGKDTVKKIILSSFSNVHSIVGCTVRPKRENEIDGVDYHFKTLEEFGAMILESEMLEVQEFNEWFYGTTLSALKEDKVNIGIFSPASIEQLLMDKRLTVIPIYIQCSDKERLLRILSREEKVNCAEVCRRYLADLKDFSDIEFDYVTFQNNSNKDDIEERITQLFNSL